MTKVRLFGEQLHHRFLKKRKCIVCDVMFDKWISKAYTPCIKDYPHNFRSDYRKAPQKRTLKTTK